MDCNRTCGLLQAYVDGELDVATSLSLEDHLARCESCRERHRALHGVRSVVNAGIAFETAPPALRRRIEGRLRAEAERTRPWWRRTPALVVASGAVALLVAALALGPLVQDRLADDGSEKIVYHINETTDPATALRNLATHLDSTPGLRAVVVAHNKGVDFLLEGARDPETGEPFGPHIADLQARGVDFRVCGNTLERREIAPSRVVREARLVPSGIAEIGRLQTKEGYAYLRL